MKNQRRVIAGKKVSSHSLPKSCAKCGRPFLGTGKQKYCTRSCKEEAQKTKVAHRCKYCGNTVNRHGVGRAAKYCSLKCKSLAKRQVIGKKKPCAFCGERFVPQKSGRQKYCSETCKTRSESRRKYIANAGDASIQMAAATQKLEGKI